MSNSSEVFNQLNLDTESLLAHFNKLNTRPPPPENEVLIRAGLIMAMAAWQIYVEDRLWRQQPKELLVYKFAR